MGKYFTKVLIIALFVNYVCCDEICTDDEEVYSCEHGCCGSGCCLSPGQIVGIVFGCIAIVCFIGALVFCCWKLMKKPDLQVQPVDPAVGTVTVISSGYPTNSATRPLPPGYGMTHPGHYPNYSQPVYSSIGGPPPTYQYPQNAQDMAYPPSAPPSNTAPLAAAAHQATNKEKPA